MSNEGDKTPQICGGSKWRDEKGKKEMNSGSDCGFLSGQAVSVQQEHRQFLREQFILSSPYLDLLKSKKITNKQKKTSNKITS